MSTNQEVRLQQQLDEAYWRLANSNEKVAELRAVINDMCMVANVASGWNKVTNAQVAQLREAINNIGFELDYLSSGVAEKLNRAMSTSSDTWLAEHDKAVEVKVLERVTSNCICSFDRDKVTAMIESRSLK